MMIFFTAAEVKNIYYRVRLLFILITLLTTTRDLQQ